MSAASDDVPVDPGELRWATGSFGIGYLGEDRWRVVEPATAQVRELSRGELVGELIARLEQVPHGAAIEIAHAGVHDLARDLGAVELIAPGVHDVARIAWRQSLVGVLPAGLVPIDVYAASRDGLDRRVHRPVGELVHAWLQRHRERCRATGVPLPADRFGAEWSAAAFGLSADRGTLIAKLRHALIARIAASRAPAEVVDTAERELEALGHRCTFAESDGHWTVWGCAYFSISWSPDDDDPRRGECLVEASDHDDGSSPD